MRWCFCLCVLWLLAGLFDSPAFDSRTLHAAFDRDRSQHVRPLGNGLRETLRDAYLRSPTIRALIDELERSDVIVHIIPGQLRSRPAGLLQFVVASPEARFLRITINTMMPAVHRAAMLGHELQHAAEVARARWVVDTATLRTLYLGIGRCTDPAGTAERFETDAAQRVQSAVLAELEENR